MYTLRQYLDTLEDPAGLTRTLDDLTLMRDSDGRIVCSAGNSAVTFRILHRGVPRALKCYFTPRPQLSAIYGERLLARELYLFTSPDTGVWVDVVMSDWIEGETLDKTLREAARRGDTSRLDELSSRFDALALQLLREEWAHGDLKPENILVTPEGELRLIDFDAVFLPSFEGQCSTEIGTAAYQHPSRTPFIFDAAIDDYPAALISTALHALKCDPTLAQRYPSDGVIFTPRRILGNGALDEILRLFARRGMAAEYRIARLLTSPTHRLPDLPRLLEYLTTEHPLRTPPPELVPEEGLWGFRSSGESVIPPIYDSGFDFSEGLVAVEIGRVWHFIDTGGHCRLSFEEGDIVKPFSHGRAKVIRRDKVFSCDPMGRLFEN